MITADSFGRTDLRVVKIIGVSIIGIVLLAAFAAQAMETREPRSGERENPSELREQLAERFAYTQEQLFATRDLMRARATAMREDEIVVKFRDRDTFDVVALRERTVSEALTALRARDDVEYAEPNYLAHAFAAPNDPYYRYQWHLEHPTSGSIHAEGAWSESDGQGVTVAVIDTGVAYEDYWDARQRTWFARAPDFADTGFVDGYDFVNNDTHANDDNGHGTHVAGTIAQSTGNGEGVAGVAPSARIMPLKVLDARGSGTYAAMAEAIRYAADHGAHIINLSLGGVASATYLEAAVRYAHEKGVTIVAAAGNNGSRGVMYPAAYDDYVIAVGATRFDESRAWYSNYGPELDFVAPGGDTNVDQNSDGYGDGVLQQTLGRSPSEFGYYFYSGTSMAAPHVAGAAALLHSADVATTPAAIERVLAETARDLGAGGWDERYGHGLINAAAAMSTPRPRDEEPTQEPVPDEEQTSDEPHNDEEAPDTEPSKVNVFTEDFEAGIGAWQQDWQGDWDDSRREARNGRYSARIDGFTWDAALVSPEVSLAGYTSATITFSWYLERSLDWGEYLAMDVSTDGGARWQEYRRLEGNVDAEDVWHDEQVSVSDADSVMVRFRGSMTRGSEDAYVDAIGVVAQQ